MTPEEWPIAASAADISVLARRAGRERLATVRADFFLPPEERLTEQERAFMGAMLHHLVHDVVGEIRAALPPGSLAANDGADRLVERLVNSGLLDIPDLVALLLQSADEQRLGTAALARTGRGRGVLLQGLISNDAAAVSAAAMRLIIARGGRRDRFGQRLLLSDDLPQPIAEILVHACAAVVRMRIVGKRAAEADSILTSAADRALSRHDVSRSEAAATEELGKLLAVEAGADAFTLAACCEGEVGIAAATLAQRSAIPFAAALDEMLSGRGERIATLFRTADVARDTLVALVGAVGDLFGIDDSAEAIACFDSLTAEQIDSARIWLAAPKLYRAARNALEVPRGDRPF